MRLPEYVRAATMALLNRVGLNRELDEEIRSHIQMHADDLERAGLSRTEAERRAQIAFGWHERFKEEPALVARAATNGTLAMRGTARGVLRPKMGLRMTGFGIRVVPARTGG